MKIRRFRRFIVINLISVNTYQVNAKDLQREIEEQVQERVTKKLDYIYKRGWTNPLARYLSVQDIWFNRFLSLFPWIKWRVRKKKYTYSDYRELGGFPTEWKDEPTED